MTAMEFCQYFDLEIKEESGFTDLGYPYNYIIYDPKGTYPDKYLDELTDLPIKLKNFIHEYVDKQLDYWDFVPTNHDTYYEQALDYIDSIFKNNSKLSDVIRCIINPELIEEYEEREVMNMPRELSLANYNKLNFIDPDIVTGFPESFKEEMKKLRKSGRKFIDPSSHLTFKDLEGKFDSRVIDKKDINVYGICEYGPLLAHLDPNINVVFIGTEDGAKLFFEKLKNKELLGIIEHAQNAAHFHSDFNTYTGDCKFDIKHKGEKKYFPGFGKKVW